MSSDEEIMLTIPLVAKSLIMLAESVNELSETVPKKSYFEKS
jgi:hypothetical protein